MNQKIVVCGAGTMGRSIAQLAAQNGYSVVLYDLQANAVQTAQLMIGEDLERLVAKGKLNGQEKDQITSRITYTTNTADCTGDLIIEAVVEILEVKVELFQCLQKHNPPSTILASNTSSISIASIANELEHPERVAGLHFFNPATIMKLVEVVKTEHTSPQVTDYLMNFARSLQKTPVLCRDAPGFIVNHAARPYYLESLYLHKKGVPLEMIDELLEQSGFKMGPFRLLDLIGNDINYAVSDIVYQQLGKPNRLQPSLIQKAMVEKGHLGRKTGKGFYDYK
ncbi:3-hydroxyacyl-CoA dehydrogenase family protein [Gynurincola endophyticus]|uniref:3-hydroxyacyl-CoA dehydrogenase family protein n=1 Tax=Gynurincola endophyticus TaxID=2479004 RepID=UPI000F8E07DD|nr:3-hydroxyacyl-CoA dehydrogenase NAD-binding domain-containing protein [Gynurincola endophyticus]